MLIIMSAVATYSLLNLTLSSIFYFKEKNHARRYLLVNIKKWKINPPHWLLCIINFRDHSV